MKLKFLIIYFLLAASAKAQMVINHSTNNFVYTACENKIDIKSTSKSQKLSLQVSCGMLTKVGKNKYTWKICERTQNTVTFYTVYKNGKRYKRIDSTILRIEQVPDPTIKIHTFDPPAEYVPRGGIPKSLTAIVEDADYTIQFTVKEFQIKLVKLGTDTIILKNIGSIISKENRQEIFKLKKGDQYQFSQIVVTNQCEKKARVLKETEFIKVKDQIENHSTSNYAVLYYEGVNSLQFLSTKFAYTKFKLVASAGTIANDGSDNYTWQTCDTNIKQVVFKCYRNKKMIGRVECKIMQTPNPTAFVAPSKEYYSFTRCPKGVRAFSMAANLDLAFFVKRFTVIIEKRNGDKSYYDNKGPLFSW